MRAESLAAWLSLLLPGAAPPPQNVSVADPSKDVVIVGHPDIVVRGHPPRCRPRAGDPQDAVDMSGSASGPPYKSIRIDPATGRWALLPDIFPKSGPEVWQRAGRRLDEFVFRVPDDGSAICIGARERLGPGNAQLRRAFDARPYSGRYMVLTASVATRDAGRVDMWIAAGARDSRPRSNTDLSRDLVAGGFKRVPLTGNYKWHQVRFLIGPVSCMAHEISYGVQLRDGGDVWLANVHFTPVPETQLSASMKTVPHGAAMLQADPVCQHFVAHAPLFARFRDRSGAHLRGDSFLPVRDDAEIYPDLELYYQPHEGQFVRVPDETTLAQGLIEF